MPPPSAEQQRAAAAEHAQQLERVRLAFRQWDRDGDGRISTADVASVLQAAQFPFTEGTLSEMLSALDANRDGAVSWDEFERAALHKLTMDRFTPPRDVETEMEQAFRRHQPHK